MVAVLVCAAGLTTVAVMVSVCGTPGLTVPTVHTPADGVVGALARGRADTKVSPAGSRSVTCTPVAASGPLLVRVTVKVIWSPTLGVASLTVLVTARSACWGVSVALAVLLPVFGSNWSASLMVAVLVCAAGLTTVAVMRQRLRRRRG